MKDGGTVAVLILALTFVIPGREHTAREPGTHLLLCSDGVDGRSAVIAGLDPAIHPFTKMMDPRVKPAGDT
jgi:hypothetical protein